MTKNELKLIDELIDWRVSAVGFSKAGLPYLAKNCMEEKDRVYNKLEALCTDCETIDDIVEVANAKKKTEGDVKKDN